VNRFRWNHWNIEHLAEHRVAPGDAEHVVNLARRPYPRQIEDEKFYIAGQSPDGTYLQVIYVLDADDVIYVIHARPLTDREKRIYRRSKR
jgi:uncharacterized DUF497 family protein